MPWARTVVSMSRLLATALPVPNDYWLRCPIVGAGFQTPSVPIFFTHSSRPKRLDPAWGWLYAGASPTRIVHKLPSRHLAKAMAPRWLSTFPSRSMPRYQPNTKRFLAKGTPPPRRARSLSRRRDETQVAMSVLLGTGALRHGGLPVVWTGLAGPSR